MYSVRFSGLDESLRFGLEELSAQLGLVISERAKTEVSVAVGDSLSIRRTEQGFALTYSAPCEFFRALSLLPDVLAGGADICERARYQTLAYLADVSRAAVPTVETVKKLIRYLALMGYNGLQLYTEDTYELPGHPYFGHMRGRYTAEELREIDDYAYAFGIEVIPCVQTLAHLSTALRWPEFSYKDTDDILLVGDDRTYALIDDMLTQLASCLRSRRIDIGMDEAHMLGRGKYLDLHGYRNAFDIFLEHLHRVYDLCKKHGYTPMTASDMFFRIAFDGAYYVKEGEIPQSVIDKYPRGVDLQYWDYYHDDIALLDHMLACHERFGARIVFMDGAWKWKGMAPHNAYGIDILKTQLDVIEKHGIADVIVTGWGDDGAEAALFSVLASILYNAERCYASSEVDEKWLDRRAQHCCGATYEELLAFDIPNQLPRMPKSGRRSQNPCKYLLYNDPLERLMDCHLDPKTVNAAYAENAEKLMALASHPEFGYIYEMYGRLCRVLSIKADMGWRLYRAYGEGDKATLRKIASEDIPATLEELALFIKAFRKQWRVENKSFGFITHDIRLGGLAERMRAIAELVLDYVEGRAEKIEELEYAPLPQKKKGYDSDESPYRDFHIWRSMVVSGIM